MVKLECIGDSRIGCRARRGGSLGHYGAVGRRINYDGRRCALRVLVDFRAHTDSGHVVDSHGTAAALGCHQPK